MILGQMKIPMYIIIVFISVMQKVVLNIKDFTVIQKSSRLLITMGGGAIQFQEKSITSRKLGKSATTSRKSGADWPLCAVGCLRLNA